MMTRPGKTGREGLDMEKISHALALPFKPRLTRTLMRLERFEDLDVDKIRARIYALLIDVDGTLVKHQGEDFSPAVIEKLIEIRETIPACIFSNNTEARPIFRHLGIPVVRAPVAPKPDPTGFDVAIQLYLQNRHPYRRMLYPSQCAMIGDNPLTDGGCRRIGMHFIMVDPIPGNEPFFHKLTRSCARGIKRVHDLFRK